MGSDRRGSAWSGPPGGPPGGLPGGLSGGPPVRPLEGLARWGYAAYQLAAGGGLLAASPYLLWRARRAAGEMRERRGHWDPVPPTARGGVWIHAASLGEARAAIVLSAALDSRGVASIMSVMTPAARGLDAAAEAAGVAAVRFVPLDYAPLVRRVLAAVRPRCLLICETELWPALLMEARRAHLPAAFVSARLTRRGARRQRWWGPLLRPLLADVYVGAQGDGDARRWRRLGARPERLAVTGNLKYHAPAGPWGRPERERARRGWEHVFVLGSVRSGEFEEIARAIGAMVGGAGRVLVVVVPRHPERAARLWERLRRLGLPWHERHSREEALLPHPEASSGVEILAVSTMGELRGFYGLADAGFVGGTLAPIGGHSLFEVAELGVPVFHGPHTDQVADVAAVLRAHGGGREVADGAALGEQMLACRLSEGHRREMAAGALRAAQEVGGAAARTLQALDGWGFPLPCSGGGG